MQYIIIGVMAAVMVFCAILAAKYSKEQKERREDQGAANLHSAIQRQRIEVEAGDLAQEAARKDHARRHQAFLAPLSLHRLHARPRGGRPAAAGQRPDEDDRRREGVEQRELHAQEGRQGRLRRPEFRGQDGALRDPHGQYGGVCGRDQMGRDDDAGVLAEGQ